MDSVFLGTGWTFPPAFHAGGREIEMAVGEEDIRQSLELLLSTRLGERVLMADFGSNMDQMIFGEVNQALTTQISDTISDAILHYEPRITLEKVEIDADHMSEGVLTVNISYVIKAVNSRFNMIYPFYINETSRA